MNFKNFIDKNSSSLLSIVTGASFVMTIYFSVKDTIKNYEIYKDNELKTKEKIKQSLKNYIPTIACGTITIGSIIANDILKDRSRSKLLSAYIALEKSYKIYRSKANELYGDGADHNIKNDIAKDNYEDYIYPTDDEEIMVYDTISERYISTNIEKLLYSEIELNRLLNEVGRVYLNDFYHILDVEEVPIGDNYSWTKRQLVLEDLIFIDFDHERIKMEDGMECLMLHYRTEPTSIYLN